MRATLTTETAVKGPVDERFRVLTIGHVNTNKRAEAVIRAIGASSVLRERTVYRLVGAIRPEIADKLARLARETGVNITISGEVDDESMVDAIRQADVVSCLRWPALEAASASTIEALLYGKSTIVTDTGFYSEIPDAMS